MPINTNGHLWIYCLNVGQGDTTVIVTPEGKVMIVDAMRPDKLAKLLTDLGQESTDAIDHLVVTHPHSDHYSAGQWLVANNTINHVTLSSLWLYRESKPGYDTIINQIDDKRIPVTFLSGYSQYYPDDTPFRSIDTLCLEMLGPSNQLITDLEQANKLITNHRSIMARLQWQGFVMVIAGDAQMENWAHFDAEQMLDCPCTVLRAAHHGSANGTQYERLDRLAPEIVVVSSNPYYKDELPDVVGCSTFYKFQGKSSDPIVALTHETGTIKIDVAPDGGRTVSSYGDAMDGDIQLAQETPLTGGGQAVMWKALLESKI